MDKAFDSFVLAHGQANAREQSGGRCKDDRELHDQFYAKGVLNEGN